jgi:hypothetical protein
MDVIPVLVRMKKEEGGGKHTTTGTPFSCATLAIASKSGTLYLGFPIVST